MNREAMTVHVPGWPVVEPAQYDRSRAAALGVLRDVGETRRRLAYFYNPRGNYAGASFVTVGPNKPDAIDADDLFAVALLEVTIQPAAARRVLSTDFGDELRAVPSYLHLDEACAETLIAGDALYQKVRGALADPRVHASDPWVTASKLVARKRPALMPVRDYRVRALLQLERVRKRRAQWLVYQCLMRDQEIRAHLDTAAKLAQVTDVPLRLLDAALWTRADEDRRHGQG